MTNNFQTLSELQKTLKNDEQRNLLISHPVLKHFKEVMLSKDEVSMIIGQWYYPLQNFPYFLSSSISHLQNLSIQTFLSDILHEELGCGNPENSHLDLYISTCTEIGLEKEKIVNSPAFEATKKLIDGYKASAKKQNSALGFIYATEVADLAMVSSIGATLAFISNKSIKDLPWVDIHIQQEPNHVNNVDNAIDLEFSSEDFNEILFHAKKMWTLWIEFFDEIGENLSSFSNKNEVLAVEG
ncbi:pyrroloquinoline quinone (PQQ) biosynthesis protein C [Flavobacterium sp. 90]|uniref:iron-containing redox enzyme family protein n=1 Tax=unclassified Flavobacterium TaxID=196869 RepID=UPI000EAC4754|nr:MULTISPECIES: iron-containing redox enzyme family protein [unclassified Flavobacterium]RKR04560.1 pyrroloquinoline quinone (PQQ) biosynthesis protein C [Flavobacterium sp. 81]TCK55889.1 pyrroloquinoline quinone (PQQ) biosynthesis protein C [Flavobacterium sp. 90]